MTHVHAVLPFATPHVACIVDELARLPGIRVTRADLASVPPRRAATGWRDAEPGAGVLRPHGSLRDMGTHLNLLLRADVAILPGPFHLRSMPAHALARRAAGRPTLFWSERYLDRRPRSAAKLAVLRAILASLDSPAMALLAIGDAAADHMAALGVTQWRAWRFGFAVPPAPAASPLPRGPDGQIRLVLAGDLSLHKGPDIAFDALSHPVFASLPWTLRVLGEGPMRGLLADRARACVRADRVTFEGVVTNAVCRRVLAESDVLLVPSRFDGWGAVVNEACEHGLAVVCSDAAGASVLLDGEDVFPSGDSLAMAARLHALASDATRLAATGARNRKSIERWRPAALASLLGELCHDLAAGRRFEAPSDGPLSELAWPDGRPLT